MNYKEKVMKNIILHIDMNSYFAAVEQQANPFLRGRSVGVCAYLSPNGVIIASSVEAKQKGIKTGCKVRDAKRMDPHIVLLENEPAKYRSTTQAIFNIFKEYSDTVEPYSIDEAFLDLSGWVKNVAEAELKAREIQERIKIEVGEWLNSSVGISWTKFLAKFASDIAPKKSILTIADQKSLAAILKGRSLRDAWGINYRTEARLQALGIEDLGMLRDFNKDIIRRNLGRYGYYLWANVNGLEISKVNKGAQQARSLGHSYCLPKKTADKAYLSSVLYKLCEKTGRRLRKSEQEAGIIRIFFAYTRGGGAGQNRKTPDKMFTTEEIFIPANKFLENCRLLLPVRMIAVSVARLSPVSGQMSFLYNKLEQRELSRAIDSLNDKYGEYTVIPGRMFNMEKTAVDRIGFRKTVDINFS